MLPLGITISGIAIISELQGVEERQAEIRRIQAFEAIENRIYVKMNEWNKGFDYDGKELVAVNVLMNDDFYHTTGVLQNLEKVGDLVIEDSNEYYRFYQLEILDVRRVKAPEWILKRIYLLKGRQMSTQRGSSVRKTYTSDSASDVWGEYYKPFYSNIDWDFWKIFDYDNLIGGDNGKRKYAAVSKKRIINSQYDSFDNCKLGGEMDFNFNSDKQSWQKDKYGYYEDILEKDDKMKEADKDKALEILRQCRKTQYTRCNLSVIIVTGGLNSLKGKLSQDRRALDRFDAFIYILSDYFHKRNAGREKAEGCGEDYMHIIFSEAWHSAKGNRECLGEYLNLYTDINDYFMKNYNIDDNELIKALIHSGKEPIDSGERVMEYLRLANWYWREKEKQIEKILVE